MSEKKEIDFETLREEISTRYSTLSKRLREIAKFSLDHPTDMAIETIAVISQRAKVQPSVLIRFAKTFGYNGFSEMQKSFQSRVVERSANYKERVRTIRKENSESIDNISQSILQQYCKASITSLQELQKSISSKVLEETAELLEAAENIYIMAQRRSFPVATCLNYAFNHAGHRTHLLSSTGGMLFEVAHNMKPKDVLIAISFPPYSPETSKVVSIASKKNVPVIVISDSSLSPITSAARIYFQIQDAEVYTFRSLSSSMCIAQTLATLMALRNKES
jgi:DNA-binding MurR/RpiR family transcriptional regulator